jgi:hypothetical protein
MEYKNFGILASVVFAIGMVGFNLSDGTLGTNQESSAMSSSAGMLGHIEAIATDSEGNIKAYIQTDNAITNRGINCTFVTVFGAPTSAEQCSTASDAFNDIALSGTSIGAMTLQSNRTSDELSGNGYDAGTADTITVSQAATSTRASAPEVTITKAFSVTATDSVFAATLTNSTGAVFAYKDFGAQVDLTSGDSLTVNWLIQLTGSTAES